MNTNGHVRRAWVAMAAVSAGSCIAIGGTTMELRVDARDLPRKLVHSEMDIAVSDAMLAGDHALDLHYPVWVPGNHGPSGPIQNVTDLRITDCDGAELAWERDAEDWARVTVRVPDGCDGVRVAMTYIASQPSVLSASSDTYGMSNFGGLNWNSVTWYPAGLTHQEIEVHPTLTMPGSWKREPATSLRPLVTTTKRDGSTEVSFEPVPLAELVDSPVAMGEHLQTVALESGAAPHFFHTVASEDQFCTVPDWLKEKLEAMVREGEAVFGPFPRASYHFLYLFEDGIRFGLEHGQSTYMGGPRSRLKDAKVEEGLTGGGGTLLVVPHEYVHAWCGKLRAPEGLVRDDFHTPAHTELLWVYEGLTSYYDEVLGVRSGMTSMGEFRENILSSILTYQRRAGRLWRSVADTARAAGNLRDRGKYWYDLRRGQDYYGEGSLFWLEADAIIRRGTDGSRSLDDFCRAFYDVEARPVGSQATYTRADVVAALDAVYLGEDWDALIRVRLEEPVQSLDMGYLLEKIGARIEYADEPTKLQRVLSRGDTGVDLRSSLGLSLDDDGKVTGLVPDSPADEAAIGYGMRVVAVNGWVYSKDRMTEAVRASKERGSVDLLLAFGERVEPRAVQYDGGLRIPRLVPAGDGAMDVLGDAGRAKHPGG